MASPGPTTVGFPAKIPAIPACSGIASSALMLSVAKRRAASRGLADTSGALHAEPVREGGRRQHVDRPAWRSRL